MLLEVLGTQSDTPDHQNQVPTRDHSSPPDTTMQLAAPRLAHQPAHLAICRFRALHNGSDLGCLAPAVLRGAVYHPSACHLLHHSVLRLVPATFFAKGYFCMTWCHVLQGSIETWMLLEYADRGSLEQAIQARRFYKRTDATLDLVSRRVSVGLPERFVVEATPGRFCERTSRACCGTHC